MNIQKQYQLSAVINKKAFFRYDKTNKRQNLTGWSLLDKCQIFNSQGCQSITIIFNVLQDGDKKVEYRTWNPFRSKLGTAIGNGMQKMPIKPGSKVLYLGAASGTTVSHVSDLVGEV